MTELEELLAEVHARLVKRQGKVCYIFACFLLACTPTTQGSAVNARVSADFIAACVRQQVIWSQHYSSMQ